MGKKRYNVLNYTTYPISVLNMQHMLLLAHTTPIHHRRLFLLQTHHIQYCYVSIILNACTMVTLMLLLPIAVVCHGFSLRWFKKTSPREKVWFTLSYKVT